jgi:hypothetical protein
MSCQLKCNVPYYNKNGCLIMKKCKVKKEEIMLSSSINDDKSSLAHSFEDLTKMDDVHLKKPRVWFLTSAGQGLYWDDVENGFKDAVKILKSKLEEARFIRAGNNVSDETQRISNQKKILKEIKDGKHKLDLLIVTCANNNDAELVALISNIIEDDNGIEVATADVYGFHNDKAITFFGPQPCEIGKKVASKLEEHLPDVRNILVLIVDPGWGALEKKLKCIKTYYNEKSNVDTLYLKNSNDANKTEKDILNQLNNKDYNAVISVQLSSLLPSVYAIDNFLITNPSLSILNYSTDYTTSYLDNNNNISINSLIDSGKLKYAFGWNQYYIGYTSLFHSLSKTLLYKDIAISDLPFTIGNGDSSVSFNNETEENLEYSSGFGALNIANEYWWRNKSNYIEVESSEITKFYLNQEFNWIDKGLLTSKCMNQNPFNTCVIATGLSLLEFAIKSKTNNINDDTLNLNYAVDFLNNSTDYDIRDGNNFIENNIGKMLIDNINNLKYNDISTINIPEKYRVVLPIVQDLNTETIKFAAQQFIKLLSHGPFAFMINTFDFTNLKNYPQNKDAISSLSDNNINNQGLLHYHTIIQIEGLPSEDLLKNSSNKIIKINDTYINNINIAKYTFISNANTKKYTYKLNLNYTNPSINNLLKVNNIIKIHTTDFKITNIFNEPLTGIDNDNIPTWGHMMTAVGIKQVYSNKLKHNTPHLIVKNSWGNETGVKYTGEYDYMRKKNGYCLIDLLDLGEFKNGIFDIYKTGAIQYITENNTIIDPNIDSSMMHTILDSDVNMDKYNNILKFNLGTKTKNIGYKLTIYNRSLNKKYELLKYDSGVINIPIKNNYINNIINNPTNDNEISTDAEIDISVTKFNRDPFGNPIYGIESNKYNLGVIYSNEINYYKENYDNNLDLNWKINTNRKIVLFFTDIDVEGQNYDFIEIKEGNNILQKYNSTTPIKNKYIIINDNNGFINVILKTDSSVQKKGFKLRIIDISELIKQNISMTNNQIYNFMDDKYHSIDTLSSISHNMWTSLVSSIADSHLLSKPTFSRKRILSNKYQIFYDNYKDNYKSFTNCEYILTNNTTYNLYNTVVASSIDHNNSDVFHILDVNDSLLDLYHNDKMLNEQNYNNIENNSVSNPFKNYTDFTYKSKTKNIKTMSEYSDLINLFFYPDNLNISYPTYVDDYNKSQEHYWEIKLFGIVYITGHYHLQNSDDYIQINNLPKLKNNNIYYKLKIGINNTETILKISFKSFGGGGRGFYFNISNSNASYIKYDNYNSCNECGNMSNNTVFCKTDKTCISYNGPSTSCSYDQNWTRSCKEFENEITVLDKFKTISLPECDYYDCLGICNGPSKKHLITGNCCNNSDLANYECDCNTNIETGYCDCKKEITKNSCGKCEDEIKPDSTTPGDICDCNGSYVDECGTCGGEGLPINPLEGEKCDCNGSIMDECGVCGGNGLPTNSQLGELCDCSGAVMEECGCGIPMDPNYCDCEKTIRKNNCGECSNTDIDIDSTYSIFGERCDCNDKSLVYDICGVCGGDETNIENCSKLCAISKEGENDDITTTTGFHINMKYYNSEEEIKCRLDAIKALHDEALDLNTRISYDMGDNRGSKIYMPSSKWVSYKILKIMNKNESKWNWSWAFIEI